MLEFVEHFLFKNVLWGNLELDQRNECKRGFGPSWKYFRKQF